MKLENAGELVSLGTEIVKLGAALDEAQKELSAAQQRVLELEGSLRPLLTRHAELIQSAVGMRPPLPPASARPLAPVALPPVPAPAAAPSELSMAPIGSPAALPAAQQLKARVKDFLQTRVKDDAISASEVAEALHIDALIVREAMLELRHGR